MRHMLRYLGCAVLPALALAACGDGGDMDAERAAREASAAAHSAGDAVEKSWKSGEAARSALAADAGAALSDADARVRAEWCAARGQRRAALEAAGDHAAAAGSALAHGVGAAVDAYADALKDEDAGDAGADDGRSGAQAPEPAYDRFAHQDAAANPLNGSLALRADAGAASAEAALDGAERDRQFEPCPQPDRDRPVG